MYQKRSREIVGMREQPRLGALNRWDVLEAAVDHALRLVAGCHRKFSGFCSFLMERIKRTEAGNL
jgi:hypothetical protein